MISFSLLRANNKGYPIGCPLFFVMKYFEPRDRRVPGATHATAGGGIRERFGIAREVFAIEKVKLLATLTVKYGHSAQVKFLLRFLLKNFSAYDILSSIIVYLFFF